MLEFIQKLDVYGIFICGLITGYIVISIIDFIQRINCK